MGNEQLQAEQAVLGSMLIDSDIIRDALSALDDKDFQLPHDRAIFQTMRALFREGVTPDAIAVHGRLASVPGLDWANKDARNYLAQLIEITPTSANWKEYARIMREQAALARIRETAGKLGLSASVEECRPLVASLVELMGGGNRVEVRTALDMFNSFCDRQEPQNAPKYVKFGFSELDTGIYPKRGDIVMIGAEPDVGKTAFSLQCAFNMAREWNVGYFTLETDWEDIADRTISCFMNVGYSDIKKQHISEREWEVIACSGTQDYAKRKISVVEAYGFTPSKIAAVSQAYGFDAAFIDYVQLVTPESGMKANRVEQMASVSRDLKQFARSTNTLVVETAQLTRPENERTWREPNMHSIKESGQFEQDADLMLMLYKPNPSIDPNQQEHRVLKIAKNKKGRWGAWDLFFDGNHQRFEFMTKDAV